jgi:hypothetical protein
LTRLCLATKKSGLFQWGGIKTAGGRRAMFF